MELQIFARNLELTEDMRELIEKKLVGKISKYFKKNSVIPIARVTLSRGERWGFLVKVEIETHTGLKVFAENKDRELTSAVSGVSEEVVRIINKNKSFSS